MEYKEKLERVLRARGGLAERRKRELARSRGTTEANPTAVRTYYQRENNGKLGALLGPARPAPLSHPASHN